MPQPIIPNNSYGERDLVRHVLMESDDNGVTWTPVQDPTVSLPIIAAGEGLTLVTAGGVTTISNDTAARFVRRTSDNAIVNNSTTLTSDDILTLAVDENTVYKLEGNIFYEPEAGTAAGTDGKVGWDYPTGTTMHWLPNALGFDVTTDQWIVRKNYVAETDEVLFGALDGLNLTLDLSGIVDVGSTAGFITVQMAQGVAEAKDLFIKSGSWIMITRLA